MPKQGISLLPETTVRTAKPKDKPYLLRDGGGLWLVVEPSGRKWWKMRVVFAKKENSFSLGEYPTVSLASARGKRETIRKQMAEGIEPGAVRKAEKVREAGTGCFEAVAREWHKRFSSKWSTGHSETILHRLEKDVFPYIGQRAIAEIT